ncbi:THO complex subunit 5 [Scaptodrosophila lebanonensis]|uniref:THO complex subunit 5 n=1 Tax=Drosophila lebanonensis TaxID=7225 RepID=A0A6J2TF05_DROLE|nr:THO complex subunit 5 [Scaptodrosophila lebanonensis]
MASSEEHDNKMVEVLNNQFEKLREAMDEMFEMKANGLNVEGKRSSAALLFVALKHSNREVKRSIKAGRDELHMEKSKVDLSRLQLQNLLYEVSHLKKEIIRCKNFGAKFNLELLSDEEYSIKFPNTPKEQPEMSSHKKHLHRLECELKLRKALDSQYNILLSSKQELLQDNLSQAQRYTSFAPALRTLMESTKPLHDALQLSLDVEWKLGTVVKYLPKPLYLLFINMQSLQRVLDDSSFKAEVVGFESDAQMQELLMAKERASKQSTSGGERRHFLDENNSSESSMENLQNRSLEPHPLHIKVIIGSADSPYHLLLIIRYWGRLKCTTVRAEFCCSSNNNHQGDANFVQDLLRHLYPNDLGDEIPISGIDYELQNLNMTSEDCMDFLIKNDFGYPYCWLQSMCSIPTVNKSKLYKHELNLHNCTREVITRIRSRWNSWLKLTQQIRGLTYKDIDLYSLKENIYPAGLACSLVQCTAITLDEFHHQNADAINYMSDTKCITYSTYRAVVVRGSAKMECFIQIPSNYPMEMPIWVLSIHWNGCHTSKNNSAIKMMECWTNSLQPKHLDPNDNFLYVQLFRTIYSFDIFLETEGSMQSNIEYNKEKPYISAFAKRIRLRPYRYIKKGSVYAFKQ